MRHKLTIWFAAFLMLFVLTLPGIALDTEPIDDEPYEEPDNERLEPLTLEDLVKLSQADISDEIIISQIIASESSFQLSADDIIYLKENGVSEALIDFLINTPTLEEWENFENQMNESDAATIEEYVEEVEPVQEEIVHVYRHVYVDVNYWDTIHPYWYWDTHWQGIYPIGYYYYNGRYHYYFGLHYWYYHPHCHNYNYSHYNYKPPRPAYPTHRYKKSYDDRSGQRYKSNDPRRGSKDYRPKKSYDRSVKSYQGKSSNAYRPTKPGAEKSRNYYKPDSKRPRTDKSIKSRHVNPLRKSGDRYHAPPKRDKKYGGNSKFSNRKSGFSSHSRSTPRYSPPKIKSPSVNVKPSISIGSAKKSSGASSRAKK